MSRWRSGHVAGAVAAAGIASALLLSGCGAGANVTARSAPVADRATVATSQPKPTVKTTAKTSSKAKPLSESAKARRVLVQFIETRAVANHEAMSRTMTQEARDSWADGDVATYMDDYEVGKVRIDGKRAQVTVRTHIVETKSSNGTVDDRDRWTSEVYGLEKGSDGVWRVGRGSSGFPLGYCVWAK